MKIVIFDGISGAGKTTLRYELFKRFNYNILTIDRFTPSIWAYDYLRGKDRTKDVDDIEWELFNSNLEVSVVLCYCRPEIAKKRTRVDVLRNVEFTPEQETEAFEKYEDVSRLRIITIDTSDMPVSDCVDYIVARI
jgi:thymidylate kinase